MGVTHTSPCIRDDPKSRAFSQSEPGGLFENKPLSSSCLQRSPQERLLQSALEHLDLVMQEQTLRRGSPTESASLLYADVCIALAETSAVARRWAASSYQEVYRRSRALFSEVVLWIETPHAELASEVDSYAYAVLLGIPTIWRPFF